LYVVLSPKHQGFDQQAARFMKLLLPYIDTALRQVSHLPAQYPDPPPLKIELHHSDESSPNGSDGNAFQLSQREFEIMHWVQLGKTNLEIGLILDISSFTVKNHLQRIFRKINVMNRAQAVSILSKAVLHHNAGSAIPIRQPVDPD
ncbi:MAG: LuxR C-terminal-related transcriptional regulator, partial [Georgfuchsia sp.]